ncbi:MAG: NDP-sugar synthase, partial [Oscillospiraceae bacterium]|nr:NDP-sugar synthase [Oscillospiraceae bacterium]
MKAIITAGGEGTRLLPMTAARPKPMVRLLGRPVLDYILELLRLNGFDDICLTLRHLPDAILARYGDGSRFGVRIRTRTEKEPLGTAGGVRACADFVGGSDVLVIAGDCVCDLDLHSAMEAHRKSGADATIVTRCCDDPTEYGAVVSEKDGRIVRFREKPAWEAVVTAEVSTGIYLLSPAAIGMIPEGTAYDFGQDLFPAMLKKGMALYACPSEGYWCDVGSPEAYLRCTRDALGGEVKLSLAAPKVRGGVWSASPLPADAVAAPPVYVGEDVLIEPGARLGPDAVIGRGSLIGRGAVVSGSVVDGAILRENARAEGSVLCEGSVLGEGAVLAPGCILGDGSSVGKGALLSENTRVPPGKLVPENARVRPGFSGGGAAAGPVFSAGGLLHGEKGKTLAPETGFMLGAAAAALGDCVLSCDGTPAAAAAALSLECGALFSGARAVVSDASFDAAAAFAGGLCGADCSVYLSFGGDPYIRFFGRDGLSLPRADERRLEAAMRGERPFTAAHAVKSRELLTDVSAVMAAAAARLAPEKADGVAVCVPGRSAAARTVREALRLAGCRLSPPARRTPVFSVSPDGFSLSLKSGDGEKLSCEQTLLLTALAAHELGEARIAAPPGSPAAMEKLGLPVLRGGGEAEALLRRQPF